MQFSVEVMLRLIVVLSAVLRSGRANCEDWPSENTAESRSPAGSGTASPLLDECAVPCAQRREAHAAYVEHAGSRKDVVRRSCCKISSFDA